LISRSRVGSIFASRALLMGAQFACRLDAAAG